MKTSNKLVVAALVVVLVSLVAYDYLLKAAFVSGKYKDPYYSFVSLKNTGFDTVDIVSSTVANVKFIQGPFSVRIDSTALAYVQVKQTGKRLQINAVFENNYLYNHNPYVMVISCPKLLEISTDANYLVNGKQITDSIAKEDWRKVLIDGFKQDSLTISQDYGSTLILANNHINLIDAVIGKSLGSGSKLIIREGNQFKIAKINVFNNSNLLLNNAAIGNLDYHLADSAKLTVTGAAQNLLNQTKPQQK